MEDDFTIDYDGDEDYADEQRRQNELNMIRRPVWQRDSYPERPQDITTSRADWHVRDQLRKRGFLDS